MNKTAVLFSGQGAQFVGMGKDLYGTSVAARRVFDMAEGKRPGLLEVCFEGPKEELTKTINAQPALFCVGLASYLTKAEQGLKADVIAGFSLGEIPALAAAGVLTHEAAFDLVVKRAQYMDECCAKYGGTMAAVIGLESDAVEAIIRPFGDVVCVNYNTPAQTVISGKSGMDAACDALKAKGARIMRLAVSGAFHSPYMDDAAKKMAKYLDGVVLDTPTVPLYSNVTGRLYEPPYSQSISRQINSPVRWTDIIINMRDSGVTEYVECGAGTVLTGLLSKILDLSANL